MAFNNSIALAQKYLARLDKVYQNASKTAILDTTADRLDFINANTVKIMKLSLDGAGDYDRNTGYVDGSATTTWETKTLEQDRGRRFLVDTMDQDEALNLLLPNVMGEFVRTKIVPELDAYRMSKYASLAGLTGTPVDITVGTTDVPTLIDEAEGAMNDEEVPEEGRILFVSEDAYAGLKAKITRILANERDVNRQVEVYNNMRIVKMPKKRFATLIDLYDGKTSGEEAGGYVLDPLGYRINFMIIHPTAVAQVVKHVAPAIIPPDMNPGADGWLAKYRIYHDAFAYDNKVKGIYLNRKSTTIGNE